MVQEGTRLGAGRRRGLTKVEQERYDIASYRQLKIAGCWWHGLSSTWAGLGKPLSETADLGDAWETQRSFVFHDSLLPPIEFLSVFSNPYAYPRQEAMLPLLWVPLRLES